MKLSKFASLAVILACALAVSACANTVRGVKRDVGQTANALEE